MSNLYLSQHNSLKKYLLNTYLSLAIFIIYKIYLSSLTSFSLCLKTILIIFLSIFIAISAEIIYQKFKLKSKINFTQSYSILYSLIMTLFLPNNFNYLLYFIVLFILLLLTLFIQKYLIFNPFILIYLVLSLFINFTSYNTLVFTILCIISYFILTRNMIYKKDIALVVSISYLLLNLFYCLFTQNTLNLSLFNYLIFISLYIAASLKYSPYLFKDKLIYSILFALLTFILNQFFDTFILILIILEILQIGYFLLKKS